MAGSTIYCGVLYMQEHRLERQDLEAEPVGGETH